MLVGGGPSWGFQSLPSRCHHLLLFQQYYTVNHTLTKSENRKETFFVDLAEEGSFWIFCCPSSLQESVESVLAHTAVPSPLIQHDSSGKRRLFVLSPLVAASRTRPCLFVIQRSDVSIQKCWCWHLSEDLCENESGHMASHRKCRCRWKRVWNQILIVLARQCDGNLFAGSVLFFWFVCLCLLIQPKNYTP